MNNNEKNFCCKTPHLSIQILHFDTSHCMVTHPTLNGDLLCARQGPRDFHVCHVLIGVVAVIFVS